MGFRFPLSSFSKYARRYSGPIASSGPSTSVNSAVNYNSFTTMGPGPFVQPSFVPDLSTYNAILKGLFRENRIIEARIMFRKILSELDAVTEGFTESRVMFREILSELDAVVTYRVDYGFEIVGSFIKRGFLPGNFVPDLSTYNAMLQGLFREKRIIEARIMFRKILSQLDRVTILDNIDFRDAVTFRVDYGFAMMGSFFKHGVVPDLLTYNAILKGLFEEKRIIEAHIFFRNIVRERLCEVDADTFCTVLVELCNAHKTSEAIELLRAMDSALFDEILDKYINLDRITYTTLICGLCNMSRWREVKILLKSMLYDDLYLDEATFTTIIDGFCKEDLIDEAVDVFCIMLNKHKAPNVDIFNSLMGGYCLQGRIHEARFIFDCMDAYNIAPNTDTLNISSALMGFDEMQSFGELHKPDFYEYCNFLSALCTNKKAEQALLLLHRLEHQGENLYLAYYNIVLDGLCKSKEFQTALAVLHDLHIKGLKPNTATYNIMIRGFCQYCRLEDANNLILSMQQESVWPDGGIYNAIVQENLRRGNYDDAAKIMREMGEKGFYPDEFTYKLLTELPYFVPTSPKHDVGRQTCMKMVKALKWKLSYWF